MKNDRQPFLQTVNVIGNWHDYGVLFRSRQAILHGVPRHSKRILASSWTEVRSTVIRWGSRTWSSTCLTLIVYLSDSPWSLCSHIICSPLHSLFVLCWPAYVHICSLFHFVHQCIIQYDIMIMKDYHNITQCAMLFEHTFLLISLNFSIIFKCYSNKVGV